MSNEKKKPHISPERMDRYTWHVGEIKFLSAEEVEQIKRSKNFIDYHVSDKNSADNRKE
ncbi:MAG: hypothetical protein IKZ53_03655 [Selenomonadaceae bacterium]|nr:hypothetical protein [Selenomonadaceae bacterium]